MQRAKINGNLCDNNYIKKPIEEGGKEVEKRFVKAFLAHVKRNAEKGAGRPSQKGMYEPSVSKKIRKK